MKSFGYIQWLNIYLRLTQINSYEIDAVLPRNEAHMSIVQHLNLYLPSSIRIFVWRTTAMPNKFSNALNNRTAPKITHRRISRKYPQIRNAYIKTHQHSEQFIFGGCLSTWTQAEGFPHREISLQPNLNRQVHRFNLHKTQSILNSPIAGIAREI